MAMCACCSSGQCNEWKVAPHPSSSTKCYSQKRCSYCMLNSIFPVLGRYVTFRPFARVPAISFAASILRSSIIPKPNDLVASEIRRAASDSPSALMTAARRSCTQFSASCVIDADGLSKRVQRCTADVNSLHPCTDNRRPLKLATPPPAQQT